MGVKSASLNRQPSIGLERITYRGTPDWVMVIWKALMATVRRTVVSTVCYPGSPVHIPQPRGNYNAYECVGRMRLKGRKYAVGSLERGGMMCINQNTHSRQCLHCPPGCKVAYLGTPNAFELCMFGKKNTPPKVQHQSTDINSVATTQMQAMSAAVHHSMNVQIPSRHKTKSSWHSATVADECHLRQSTLAQHIRVLFSHTIF